MSTQPNRIASHERSHSVREAPVSQQYAARFLNMHPQTVLRKAREGTLPAHPVGTESTSRLCEWRGSEPVSSSTGD
jgi:hypothetical protein